MNCLRAAAVCLSSVLLLAACGADGLPPTAGLSKEVAAAGGAYPSAAPQPNDERQSPLADPTEKPSGGREVIQNPTMADILAPSPLPEMSWGSASAPVTIVQYASLTCPHCRNFHIATFPGFKKSYIDTGKVRFIMREFPIGKQSGNATIALRCAKPEVYLELYGKFMMQQASWVSQEVRLDPIFGVAKQVGLTRPEFDACYKNQTLIEGLTQIKDRGRTLGIIGTPNFFVRDKLIKKELTLADLSALIDGGGATAESAASSGLAKP